MVYHYPWCLSTLVDYYFQVSFNLNEILYEAKIAQNNVAELL